MEEVQEKYKNSVDNEEFFKNIEEDVVEESKDVEEEVKEDK